MQPIQFKEQNVVFAKDQPQYRQLPAHVKDGPEGEVISCWQLTFWERIKVLFTGRIWLSMWSFKQPLTPSRLSTDKYSMLPKPAKLKK